MRRYHVTALSRRRPAAGPLLVLTIPLVLASWAAGVYAEPAGAQEVQLGLEFEEGAEHRYRQVLTSRTSTPMGEVSQTQTMVLRQDVLNVAPDGTADLRVSHESVRMEVASPMGNQSYDSESGDVPADPGMAVIAGLVGTSFDVRVAPDGGVRGVSGTDAMMEEVVRSVAELDPQVAEQVRPLIAQMLGAETQEAFMSQWMQTFPAEAVAPGEAWEGSVSVALPLGTMRSTYEYTLRDVSTVGGSRVALIDLVGAVGELEADPTNPMSGTMEFSGGEATGEITFDVDGGRLVRSIVQSTMSATAGGQTMDIESTFEMELVEP